MKESKLQLAQIMKQAWVIAKSASTKFGGKAKQYLAMALKMSWSSWSTKNAQVVFFCDAPVILKIVSFKGDYTRAAAVPQDANVQLKTGDIIATIDDDFGIINRTIADNKKSMYGFDFYDLIPLSLTRPIKNGHVNAEEC